MIENNLFNEKKMEEFIARYENSLKIKPYSETNPICEWIEKLNNNELEDEKKNYANFLGIILNKLLGYELTDISFEENIGKEGRPVEFTFKKNDKDYVVVELKGTKTKDLNKRYNRGQSAIEQVTNYASIKEETQWAFVSNYNEFRLFNPSYRERYISFKFKSLTNPEILKKFLLIFSKFSLIDEDIPQTLLKETRIMEKELEDEFYQLFNETRLMFIKELEHSSEDICRTEAIRLAQLILNRYIFICFAEDLLLIPPETTADVLLTPIEKHNLFEFTMWDRLNELFRFMDKGNPNRKIGAFNGGLFKENLRNLEIRDFIEDLTFFDDCYKKWRFQEKYEEINSLLGDYKNTLNPIYKNLLIISSFNFGSELSVNILGHIFENSIGDIEELKDQTKTRRKKDGVFYTPEYITDYICRSTIIPYLSRSGTASNVHELIYEYEINNELNILDNKLKNIKIVDPACGSGAFLNKAVDVLFEIHKAFHDSKYSNDNSLDSWFDDLESRKQIISENIYGVDVNEESVEITKLSLFLKLATIKGISGGFKLPNLDKNIKCGNSLIDDESIVGDKAFNWQNEFEEVFNNEGFDIVIGNPPYVSSQIKNLSEDILNSEKNYLKKEFITAHRSYDLYVLFIEKGIDILKTNGCISYIIPNKFINAAYGEKVREFLNNYYIKTLIDFGDNQIFKDAKNYTCIFIVEKENNNKSTKYLEQISNPEQLLINYNNCDKNEFAKCLEIDKKQMNNWELLEKNELTLLNKLNSFDKLSSYSKNIWEGARPGFEKAYVVYEKDIIENNLEKDLLIPFIKNEDIQIWCVNWKGLYNNTKHLIVPYYNFSELLDLNEYPNIKNHLENFRENLYDSEGKDNTKLRYGFYHLPKEFKNNLKIITPDISKYNSFALIENNDSIFPNTIYSIDLKEENEHLKYILLGILNSKLVEWYIKKISPSIRGGYYRYKSIYLEQIPIVKDNDKINEINTLVKDIIDLKTEENQVKNAYIAYLSREIEYDISLLKRKSYILKCWDYPFYGYNESLLNILKFNKKLIKININSKEIQENLEYEFNNSKNVLERLQKQILTIEKEINHLVYELYDLSPDEIDIVENSLQ